MGKPPWFPAVFLNPTNPVTPIHFRFVLRRRRATCAQNGEEIDPKGIDPVQNQGLQCTQY